MITSISTWIRTVLEDNGTAKRISEEELTQMLLGARVKNPIQVMRLTENISNIRINNVNGRVTLTMVDLSEEGTQTEYGFPYEGIFLYDDLVQVEVDGVVIASSAYTFSPISLDLTFLAARTEDNPLVTVSGLLIDLGRFGRAYGNSLTAKLAQLPSVKDAEFNRLSRRAKTAFSQLFGPRILKR